MRIRETLATLPLRLRGPLDWVAVLIFGGLFGTLEIAQLHGAGYSGWRLWLAGGTAPALCAAAYGFLAPLFWQWSGDDRPMAGLVRGSCQALACALVFFLLMQVLDRALFLHLLRAGKHHSRLLRWDWFPYLYQTPIMALVGYLSASFDRGDLARARAEARLREAQWILLRAQLSPHVLFNTLNALAELARQDPEATEKALLDLSDLYERMLRHGDCLTAPLGEERLILERYLALQALRLGRRLTWEWDWDPALDRVLAPPLLLQPLLENALKHGIAAHSGGGTVRILARRQADGLHLEVANTGQPLGPARPGSTGLPNLQARLAAAYPGKARFSLTQDGDWTRAALDLPEQPWAR